MRLTNHSLNPLSRSAIVLISLLFAANTYGQEDGFQYVDGELPKDYTDTGQNYDLVDDAPQFDLPDDLLRADQVLAIDLGFDHTCALLAGGKIRCWGENNAGQLGDGTATDSPVPVYVADISDAVAVSAGYYHSCAVHRNGQVSCWGSNLKGALGLPEDMQWAIAPAVVPGVEDAVDVTTGSDHTCALLADGRVKCWGDNEHGQLGNGTTSASFTPVDVPDIRLGTMISSSHEHTCVGEALGGVARHVSVKCWGRNNEGQAGDPALGDILSPNRIAVTTGITDISAGINHTCYNSSWVPHCLGYNASGQLGVGHTASPLNTPVYGYTDVTHIAAGRFHTCGRTTDGFIRCWGGNRSGELGLGSFRSGPTTWMPHYPVYGLWGNAVDVEVGLQHSCAILTDRSVVCWGTNGSGELGDGSTTSSNKPVAVAL